MPKISLLVDITFNLLFLLLIIGALFTWIPRMPIDKSPFKELMGLCNIFFAPFRKIIPPVGGIDFSPILAFLIFGLIANTIVDILVKLGL